MLKSNYKNIWWWILATIIIGTFWHFGYELAGRNYLVGLIAPVNESVWEHLKIVFFPLVLTSVVAFIKLRPIKSNFWTGLLLGSIAGMLITFFGFYLYTSLIGDSLVGDIILYILAIIASTFIVWWFMKNSKKIEWLEILSSVGIIIIASMLIYLTIRTPKLKPFIEESSGSYGINQNKTK